MPIENHVIQPTGRYFRHVICDTLSWVYLSKLWEAARLYIWEGVISSGRTATFQTRGTESCTNQADHDGGRAERYRGGERNLCSKSNGSRFDDLCSDNLFRRSGGFRLFFPASLGFLVPIGYTFGLAQFIAGMWAFKKNDALSATLFSSFGAFWVMMSFLLTGIGTGIITVGTAVTPLFGWLFLAFAVETLYLFIASTRHSVSLSVVTGFLLLSLLLLATGAFTGSLGIIAAGGYSAMISGICAAYTAGAHLFKDVYGRTVIPTWPRRG